MNTAESVPHAAIVIAGHTHLGRWAEQLNPQVVVIRRPSTPTGILSTPDRAGQPFVIRWVGSSTMAPYLHLLDGTLARVSAAHDAVVRVVGGSYGAPGVRVEEVLFLIDREPEPLRGFDVGIVPQPDAGWTGGKGGLTALLGADKAGTDVVLHFASLGDSIRVSGTPR